MKTYCKHAKTECRKCGLVPVSQAERELDEERSSGGARVCWFVDDVEENKRLKPDAHTTKNGRGVVARLREDT
jgi:hypothetical protein